MFSYPKKTLTWSEDPSWLALDKGDMEKYQKLAVGGA